jgi:hypothetical protein
VRTPKEPDNGSEGFESIRRTGVDSRLESYQGFFDDSWRADFLDTVRATKLREVAFDLVRNWEAASNVRSLPWKMMYGLEEKRHRQIEEEPFELRKIRNLKERLVGRLKASGVTVRPLLEKQLQNAIDDLDREWVASIRQLKDELHAQPDDVWGALLGTKDFHSSLWGSERMCYGSVYYSYEWFLKESVRIYQDRNGYRIDPRHFRADFNAAFGPTLTSQCWTDPAVNITRFTRSALAHNAGRMTAELAAANHSFLVEGDEIQIAALDTTNLFNLLKLKAMALAIAAASAREFQMTAST